MLALRRSSRQLGMAQKQLDGTDTACQRPRHAIRSRRKRAMRARFSSVLWLLGQSSNSAGPGEIRRSLTLNRSTRDLYTRCHGNTDIARLRMLPVCRWCVA
jgi:hypothetical protein